MDRNKLLAIAAGALAMLATIAYGLGNAQAASWHDYEGDVFAGHAYGLLVPADAKSYEVTLSGGDAASAKLAFFEPSGAPLGYHHLTKDLTSAAVLAPQPGRHVVYVYDLQGGALALRVDAAEAPGALDLEKIPLARNDVEIGAQDAPARLDKAFTARLPAVPVFVTLLYEGSAQDLDATVSSAKGDVAVIQDETGTAFSPGVWTTQSGTRTSDPANLDGTAYTVTVHAAQFEGRLVLAALSLDLQAPPVPPEVVPVPAPDTPRHVWTHPYPAGASFALPVGKAVAFEAPKGTLVLSPAPDDKAHAHRHEDDNRSAPAGAVSIYAPDDSLLAFVKLGRHATVDLPEDGEYVAYVHHADAKAIVAHVEGATGAVPTRVLALAEETHAIPASAFLLGNDTPRFRLDRAPVALKLGVDDALAVLAEVAVGNENGIVARTTTPASAPGMEWASWSAADPARFARGEHAVFVSGVFEGEIRVTSVHYERDATQPVEDAPEPAEPEAPKPPAPPAPTSAPDLPAVAAVLALLG